MEIKTLLAGLEYSTGLDPMLEISDVSNDSRRLGEGVLFVCITGAQHDGRQDARDALAQGAAAILTEEDLGLNEQILVPDVRSAYAILCGNYFGNPAKRLTLLGVTGTNGKTTTAAMIRSILEYSGKKCGIIGTVGIETGARRLPAEYTTPDSYLLHQAFREMADAGCTHCVLEASSQALAQHRLDGCRFAVAVFTNLSQDHLDYHGDLERYYQAKRLLFTMTDAAAINTDDPYGRRLAGEITCPRVTFSVTDDAADLTAHNIEYRPDGSTRFVAVGIGVIKRIVLPYPGLFSVYNALAAGACAHLAGIDEHIDTALAQLPQISGRVERLTTQTPFTVIRDFAHTPGALEQLLAAVRPATAGRVILLFGCGGDRDRGKRPLMGEAARAADFVVLTSDNPRTEAPMGIIDEICPGLDKYHTQYKIIQDRPEAIRAALDLLRAGDLLLLAGKGHEEYQIVGTQKRRLDEAEIVREWLAAHQ